MSSIDFSLSEVPPDRLEGVLANLQAEKTRRTVEISLRTIGLILSRRLSTRPAQSIVNAC
jgi:hypothetical protein